MEEQVIIEWTYTPENYFEGDIKQNLGTYNRTIANGKVRATFSASVYDRNNIVLDDIHNEVRALFMGVKVVSHRPYKLSKYSVYRQYPDGRRDVTVFPDGIVVKVAMGAVDFVHIDSAGNIITDTRADRIREKLEFAELSAKYSSTDSTVRRMLSSYESSVNDPSNELVHLYEIKDALKKTLGKNARALLRISEANWKRIGSLANNEPLRQGRHRGLNLETLRDATPEEIAEARNIAKRMILAYLKYID